MLRERVFAGNDAVMNKYATAAPERAVLGVL